MTKVEGNPIHIKKGLLSSDRLVFAVVCATIIGLIVETGIIRVSGFEAVGDVSADVKIFLGLGIFSVFSQLIILNFVRNKIGKSSLSRNHMRLGVISKAMLIVQLVIIVLCFVYENPLYGIKIDYPFSWDKLEFGQNNPYGLVAGFVIPREGKPPSEINVLDFILENVMLGVKGITPSPSSSSSPATLNGFVNEEISIYKQKLADFHIIKSNTTSIDNNPTYQIQYTQKDGRATFDTLQIWTISGNKIYTIIFNADPADYPTYLPVIQKIIDSFDILEDNNNTDPNNQMKLRNV